MKTFLGLNSRKITILVSILLVLDISAVYGLDDSKGKIYNGQEALPENTRFHVSIRKKESDVFYGAGVLCGGTLVSENVVISAAHCFVDYDEPTNSGYFLNKTLFSVVMGNVNRFKRNNTLQFDIKELILGVEKFDLKTYNFDVAILILDGAVPPNHPTISPIPLNVDKVANGTICQVSGWGRTEEGVTSSVLMSLDVPVLSTDFCIKNANYTPGSILPGMLCAGYIFTGYYDACYGDSGGPLACDNKLTGIVSWGFSCALPRFPGVYTDVRYYQPWIESQLKPFLKITSGFAPLSLQISAIIFMLSFFYILQ